MMDDQTFQARLPSHLRELEEKGYTVIPGYIDLATTAAIRDHLDAIIPLKLPGALKVTLGVNEIRHPIPGELMPRLASDGRTLQLARTLLRSDDLRLREQILMRTDPVPPPYSNSYHIDAPFLLEEYETTPRQIYFQMVQYCSPVSPGGAGVMIIPGSHKLTYEANRGARSEAERRALAANPLEVAQVDPRDGIEICANDGTFSCSTPCVCTARRATGPGGRATFTSLRSTIPPPPGWSNSAAGRSTGTTFRILCAADFLPICVPCWISDWRSGVLPWCGAR